VPLLYGTAVPTTEGVDGNFYLKTDTSDLYGPKTAGAWGTPTNLVGLTGPVGPQGPAGASTWAEVDKTLSALADIADVPDPVADKVLKRTLDGLSYEWGESGVSALANIGDIPTPVASQVLKRNAEDTAYEWLDIEAIVLQIEETNAQTTYTQAAAIGVLQTLHVGDIFPD
jgi:hypothetical protein